MAHEFEGSDTMFSAREVPWHRIGTVTPDVLTAADAIKAAGLDWTVDRYPVLDRDIDGNIIELPDRFFLKRSTDLRRLAIVSDIYKEFQNSEAFSFMDNVSGSGGAKYETAGSLRNGAVVFITMRLEASDFTIGGMDQHNTYLLLRTTHDGSGRISVYVVTVRVVCANTLTWAINGAKHSWGITHTADVKGKVAEARESLGLTARYTEAFQAEAESLLDIKITDDDLVKLLTTDLPERATKEMEIELIMDNYRGSATVEGYRDTAWGALNAVSEYREHIKVNRSGEALFGRILDGGDAKLRTLMKNQFMAMA